MKKALSLLLSIILIISVLLPLAADAATSVSNATRIYVNTDYTCSISTAGTRQYYYFIPSTSGTYVFTSSENGDADPYGYVVNSSGSVLASDDDSGDGRNFRVSYSMTSGTKYYLAAGLYSSDSTGSYKVRISLYDDDYPTVNVTSTSNISSSQTVTITAYDSGGISKIYFGTSDEYSDNSFYGFSSTSVSKTITVSSAGTFNIRVIDNSNNYYETSITFYTVNLSVNHGDVSYDTLLVEYGNYITLPTPDAYSGYAFVGWRMYDEDDDEYYYSDGLYVYSDNTVYADFVEGEKYTASSSDGSYYSCVYSPRKTGVYRIYSSGNYDTEGYLYGSSDGRLLTKNDDGGEDNNFSMLRYLYAGEQYEIQTKLYWTSDSGSYDVFIVESDCVHNNSARVVYPATFGAEGRTEHACSECGYVDFSEIWASLSKKNIKLAKTKYVYSGSSFKPAVRACDDWGNTLESGTDYTVKYSNNKNVGTATAKITFKGHFKGTYSLKYTILPKASSITTKNIKALSRTKIRISWAKVSGVTGYQIQVAQNPKFSGAKTIKAKSNAKYVDHNIKYKKWYYIRVRTYKTVNKTNYYSNWSKSLKIRIK